MTFRSRHCRIKRGGWEFSNPFQVIGKRLPHSVAGLDVEVQHVVSAGDHLAVQPGPVRPP